MTRLWTGEAVSYQGRWVQMRDFRIEPPPAPPPVIWIGGRSEAAMRRAVRFGNGYIPYLVSPEQLGRRRQRLVELASEADRPFAPFTLACLITLIPGPSIDDSLQLGLRSLRLSGLTPESVRSQYLLGDDESVLSRLQDYVNAGAEHLVLGCIPGDDRYVDDFFAACDRILPTARELRPDARARR
jgi:alkanesulfonate monooxygenase SsuD/methylene tetrahydromethanopterin reductase-like flavin-dependent oxidoreductase (luciferase family)